MTRQERIHKLFNELNEALQWEIEDIKDFDQRYKVIEVKLLVDGAHHDYTNIVLAEVTD
jgi:hypothetical protein